MSKELKVSEVIEHATSYENISERLNYLLEQYQHNESIRIKSESFNHFIKEYEKGLFDNQTRLAEFTFWFLKYNANKYFKRVINNQEFKRRLDSNAKRQHIKSELEKLSNDISKARRLEDGGKIQYNKPYKDDSASQLYLFNENLFHIEILRVLDGNYYSQYKTEHNYTVVESPEVKAYAFHIYYKEFLEEEQNKELDESTYPQIALYYLFIGEIINALNATEKLEGFKKSDEHQLVRKYNERKRDFKKPNLEGNKKQLGGLRYQYEGAKKLLSLKKKDTTEIYKALVLIYNKLDSF